MKRPVPAVLVAIALAAIVGCRDQVPAKLKPGQSVTLQGAIEAGAECPMLVTSDDRRFSLSGDLKTFKVGDQVCVHGSVAEMSFCMAGEAVITITITTIVPAGECK